MSAVTLILVRMESPEEPRRNADGSLVSGEQLYWELVAAEPYAIWTPERRAAARDQAYALAARYERLAAAA